MAIPRILLAEDEYLIRLTLAEALADDGFEVIEAGSAEEALALLHDQGGVALLVTDIQMPGRMNGVDLAAAAQALNPNLPVIFMTGRPDQLNQRPPSAREAFVAKPYLPSDICAAARRLTRGG